MSRVRQQVERCCGSGSFEDLPTRSRKVALRQASGGFVDGDKSH